MFVRLIIFMTLFISLTSSGPAKIASKEIVLVADMWCPYNCKPGSKSEGILIEVAKKVFEKEGYVVRYRVESWARSIILAKEGKVNGIVGAYKSDAPTFIFPDSAAVVSNDAFITLKDSSLKNLTVKDMRLSENKFGVIKDYSYSDEIDKYITTVSKKKSNLHVLHGDMPVKGLITLLKKKRIDVALEDMNVWNYYLAQMGIDMDEFKKAGSIGSSGVHIAFSPTLESSKVYAQILSKGIKKMKENGELKKIIASYESIHQSVGANVIP